MKPRKLKYYPNQKCQIDNKECPIPPMYGKINEQYCLSHCLIPYWNEIMMEIPYTPIMLESDLKAELEKRIKAFEK